MTYVGSGSAAPHTKKRYYYYSCSRRKARYDGRTKGLSCPHVSAEWLEETVWSDVRQFLENPGEVLEQVREQLAADYGTEDLEARRADLSKRLAIKGVEKDRHVRAYAQGHISEDELAMYAADLKNQVENLKLLIASVETDLATQEQNRLVVQDIVAWLLTLRKRVAEVEGDTEEARRKRRELTRLLVERITVGITEDGSTRVPITYRFDPPAAQVLDDFSHGVALSTSSATTKRMGVAPGSRPSSSARSTAARASGGL